ncbi:endonuclease [Pseudoalteromonas fenneropenaei]|uniref:Endonuclease n=1 Tax=Pseudoalteromonas fenneropenaei TaxID=1737459 RepID=A0ABV7CM31_9GAMM
MKHGKITSILALAASSCALYASAEVANGDFESWSNGLPSNWSIIDSGINVTATSQFVKSGQTAAKIIVNTTTQSETDFLQEVPVSAGQSYTFSTWLYHTEGGVKARLYVDGYQNYSDNTQVNQWQQVSFNYTASSTKNIQVGLRFYDVTGFDGSEAVYVDNFQPTTTTTTPPPPQSCSAHNVTLSLTTDNYGSETSWQLSSATGTVASGNGYTSNSTNTENFCLSDGDYTFTIFDAYGDGICCSYGNGSYSVKEGTTELAAGATFTSQQSHTFTLGSNNGGDNGGDNGGVDTSGYYASANGLTGYNLKTALYNIIRDHSNQGYGAIWTFYDQVGRDRYFENDNSILDRYSEKPAGADSYSYTAVADQCGSYSAEGGCYNREHSFPKSWFGGTVEPMHSDVHHIFATDGFVNAKRSNYPYGEVASATYTSSNGSKLGAATTSLGYSGTVFEPIDAFKGDFARAYFYMATRYQNVIGSWQNITTSSDAVLNGSSDQVFEAWVVNMLKRWHQLDPVDAAERARNDAAFNHQGNRNPYIDHPEFVEAIW